MPFDPKHPLTPTERAVFGDASYRDEITGEPVEIGEHALPVEQQRTQVHIPEIARRDGRAAADAVQVLVHIAEVERKHGKLAADAERQKLKMAERVQTKK